MSGFISPRVFLLVVVIVLAATAFFYVVLVLRDGKAAGKTRKKGQHRQ